MALHKLIAEPLKSGCIAFLFPVPQSFYLVHYFLQNFTASKDQKYNMLAVERTE